MWRELALPFAPVLGDDLVRVDGQPSVRVDADAEQAYQGNRFVRAESMLLATSLQTARRHVPWVN